MQPERADRVWKCLADPTRRAILDLLSQSPRTTGAVCSAFPSLSRFAVMKHLRVLEQAGLLLPCRDGKQVWNHLNPVPLREVYERWVGREASRLAGALIGLRTVAERDAGAPRAEAGEQDGTSVLAQLETVVRGVPGSVWRTIRSRAVADLSGAVSPDEWTLEGMWTRGPAHQAAPIRVRVRALRERSQLRVVVTAWRDLEGGSSSSAAILATAASWIPDDSQRRSSR